MNNLGLRMFCFHSIAVSKIIVVGAFTTLVSLFGRCSLMMLSLALLGIMPWGIAFVAAPILLLLMGAVVAAWRIVPVYVSYLEQGEDVSIGADRAGLPIIKQIDLR